MKVSELSGSKENRAIYNADVGCVRKQTPGQLAKLTISMGICVCFVYAAIFRNPQKIFFLCKKVVFSELGTSLSSELKGFSS